MNKKMFKNKAISEALCKTKLKRQSQTCKVREIKISARKLSKSDKHHLNMLFIEAKWVYNFLLSQEDIFKAKIENKTVLVKVKDEFQERTIKFLSSQMMQGIIEQSHSSIKTLSALKKKGIKVGKLKFKSEINSIGLKQFNSTHRFDIAGNKLKLQGLKNWLRCSGLEQLKDFDIANAKLIKRNNDFLLKVTIFENEIAKPFCGNFIGIDFGIKDALVFSNGIKIDTKIPLSKKVKQNHKILSRKVKQSKNRIKLILKLKKSYAQVTNKRKDLKNKICSFLQTNFDVVAVQNENIKGWHAGLFGRQIQQSTIGGIMARIKENPRTVIVDRWFPSTQLCRKCGKKNKLTLGDRIYNCECGYSFDRDIHSALNILEQGLKQSIHEELMNTMPAELITSKMKAYFDILLSQVMTLKQEESRL